MNAIERIKSQLSSAPVVLYMKGTPDFPQCGFSAQTAGALKACKAQFAHVNIFEDPEVREALEDAIRTGPRSRSSTSMANSSAAATSRSRCTRAAN